MHNYILFSLLLEFFVWSTNGHAQVRTFPMEEQALLWKIEGKKVKSDSYLFGTIHLMDKAQFFFPGKLDSLIRSSDQIVMEIGDLNPSDAMGYLTLKEGSFFDFFSPEQTDSILQWAQTELAMDPQQFRLVMGKMKPFVVVQMVTQMTLKGETASYELSIQQIAREQQIPTLGLETVAWQMGIFDNLDSLDQTEMVMESIRDFDKNDSIMELVQRTYLSQNVDSMYLVIAETDGSMKAMQETLLDQRNANWVPQIQKLIGRKDTFIAVGAGHLGGPNGVIRLLEKEGYVLTPVVLGEVRK